MDRSWLSKCITVEKANSALRDQPATLDAILDGEEIEELQVALGTDSVAPSRLINEINQEFLLTQRDKDKVQQNICDVEYQIEAWTEEFTSADEMLDMILDAREETKRSAQQLDDLPTVSEEIDDLATFTSEFESKRNRLQHIKVIDLPEAEKKGVATRDKRAGEID